MLGYKRLVAGLVMLGALASGCAKGDSLTGGSTGTADGAGPSDGGDTSAGAQGAGGSMADTTDNTMNMPNTTSAPTCSEDPCKLIAPQCGCEVGFGCTLDANGDHGCAQAGPYGQGDPCNESALCEAGTVCVGYADDLTTCATFCDSDTMCEAPGGKCVVGLGDSGVNVCTENCSVIGGTGCALPGVDCQLGITEQDVVFTVCALSGETDLVEQEICLATEDCAPGFACLETTEGDLRCFQWCNVNADSCPTDFPNCTGLNVTEGVPLMLGTVPLGACNP